MSDDVLYEGLTECDGRGDRYGLPDHATIRDLTSVWAAKCRELFIERYAAWPDKAKLPLDQIWEGVWQGVVTGPCVVIVRAPQTERYGLIEIPTQARADRACGFIAACSPMLWFPQVLERCAYAPMFDHPLDLIGKCYLFQPYQGVTLRSRVTDSSGTDAMTVKLRVEDLHMEMHTLDVSA